MTEWTGIEIRLLRNALGLTQGAFAVKLGMKGRHAHNAIHRLEAGHNGPSLGTRLMLDRLRDEFERNA